MNASKQTRPYTLSCHCGNLRFEVDAELDDLLQCNCSTCRRFGAIHWYVDGKAVSLLEQKRGMSTYLWKDAHGGHHFCGNCGTSIMRTGYPDGVVAINACCIEGVDIFELDAKRFDGRKKMPPGELP